MTAYLITLSRVQVPVNVRNSEDGNVCLLYNQPFQRYELLLEKSPIIKASESAYLKIPNLDVITKFLSWKNDAQEGSFMIIDVQS